MKILIDTNVILDIALERQPFVEQAMSLFEEAERAHVALYVTATRLPICITLLAKQKAMRLP
ncbi:MAG: hypothetical protein KC418_04560 [Anaerolineales bacterium]|nr:hypothetical protein [Anaerolineales bacterium]MCB8952244.1 hypothetical protein [Ardenticatenales bacterium]